MFIQVCEAISSTRNAAVPLSKDTNAKREAFSCTARLFSPEVSVLSVDLLLQGREVIAFKLALAAVDVCETCWRLDLLSE